MKTKTSLVVLFLFASTISLSPTVSYAQWQKYPYSPANSVLNFPNDDGYHSQSSTKTEWWYINLHLVGSAPSYKKYDVMLVYFRFYNMRIFNISESSGTFHSNVLQLTPTFVPQLDKWDLTYTVLGQVNDYSHSTYPTDNKPYQYVFHAEEPVKNDRLDVTVTSNRAPLVVGGDGFVPIGNGGDSSFYYSYTNMKVEGKIRYNGIDDSITSGIAWIDRQWGPFTVGVNPNNKYEWYSLQVDKPNIVLGTPQTPSEFNVWQVFSDTSSIPYLPEWRMASSIFPDDSQDTSSTYFFERTIYWHDAANNTYYPSGWRIIEPKHGVNIDVVPKISNQIVDVQLFKFWEGGGTLKGTVNNQPVEGVGFAELVADHKSKIVQPGIPAGLTITHPPDHFSLTWTPSTAGTYPIGGYRIFRSTDNNGYWQYIASTSDLFYDDYSAVPGTDYYYTVTSFDNQTATSASDYATAVYTSSSLGIQANRIAPIGEGVELLDNYPNPFASETKLAFKVNARANARLYVTNMLGQTVISIFNGIATEGEHDFTLDASKLGSGTYYCNLETDLGIVRKTMTIVR